MRKVRRRRRIVLGAGLILILMIGVFFVLSSGNRRRYSFFYKTILRRAETSKIRNADQEIEGTASSFSEIRQPFKKGWIEGKNNRYYLLEDGKLATGWHYIGGKAYYFYEKTEKTGGGPAGAQAVDYTTSGGIRIPETGYLEGDEALAIAYALDVLDRYGWTLEDAFKYSSALRFERNPEEVYGRRIHKCAIQGFQYGKGNCLAWAGTFCVMAKVMGYDCRVVWGTLPYNGEQVPHGWTEIWEEDGIHVYDPRRNGKKKLKGFNERYGSTGSFRYNEDSREYFDW